MGPQHPSTHGVLRLELVTDGEIVKRGIAHLGYLHRCFEKHAENRPYDQIIPYTDRMDYVSAMNQNLGYCLAVEKLLTVKIPDRAQWIRVIVAELNRIGSHLLSFGTYGMDIGAFTPFLYAFREREMILDLFEMICGARLTYTSFDRRLEFYGLIFSNEARLAAIRNRDGTLIQSAIDSDLNKSNSFTYGLRLDLTDDYVDPRKGVRLESSLWHSPPDTIDDPDYNIIELSLTGYLPIGKRDTIAVNYFQGDTSVDRPGETDPATVESDLGLNCSSGSIQNQIDCQSIVSNTVAENTFGSVGALGGLSRLRSYPEDRFKGSHARFVGIEYRWNLIEETRPFDIFIAKDIRTVIQIAAFYERGAIDDSRNGLWGKMRDAYGIGARLVTKSGLIFRADIATGDEGEEVSIIFGYPWEVF